jgi:hypothetical protein
MKKQNPRKLLPAILAFVLALSLPAPAFAHEGEEHEHSEPATHNEHSAASEPEAHAEHAAMSEPETDTAGHWAETTISKWIRLDRVKWHHGGDFTPNAPITRAEFVSLVNAAFNYTENGGAAFSDIAQDAWYAADVAAAANAGYIDGYEDGAFKPDAPITRGEAAKIISIPLALDTAEDHETIQAFADASAIPAWSRAYVAATVKSGFFKGYSDGKFGAERNITRAEALTLLDRVAEQREKASGVAIQEIVTDYADLWFNDEAPIVVNAGVPVRWYVNAAPGAFDALRMACGKTIKIPGLGWGTDTYNDKEGHLTLAEGKNFVYEFTPTEPGDILYTCWMGSDCHSGYIRVTAAGTSAPVADSPHHGDDSDEHR